MDDIRDHADGYARAARGGLGHPDKFTTVSLFHLTALAIEGYWIGWLESRGAAPTHHGFHALVRAAEAHGPLPGDLKRDLLALDQYRKLCEWIPLEPRQPRREDIPGLLELTARVAEYTKA